MDLKGQIVLFKIGVFGIWVSPFLAQQGGKNEDEFVAQYKSIHVYQESSYQLAGNGSQHEESHISPNEDYQWSAL